MAQALRQVLMHAHAASHEPNFLKAHRAVLRGLATVSLSFVGLAAGELMAWARFSGRLLRGDAGNLRAQRTFHVD
jgi:hypothetical protein